eukprot:4002357-Amphidinium_carterae.1
MDAKKDTQSDLPHVKALLRQCQDTLSKLPEATGHVLDVKSRCATIVQQARNFCRAFWSRVQGGKALSTVHPETLFPSNLAGSAAKDAVGKSCDELMKKATAKLEEGLEKATKLVGNKDKGIWQCSNDHP